MATVPHPTSQHSYTTMRDLAWSHSEKTIARKAFNQALTREFEVVMQEAKRMAAKIEQPSDLWNLEAYLTHSRKQIDRKYDYQYSVLILVFGRLVCQGRLSEEELRGLRQDKLESIRSHAKLLAELDAVA
jgi:Photoprotection regulator fluorescence recovery protein